MIIGNKDFDVKNNTYVMGILNVTPDSFSDGGKWNSVDRAVSHAVKMAEDGATIIDVGGESTRPGYTQISVDEEICRVAPVISAIKKQIDIPVSIDTYKADVAKAAIDSGADLVNDVWGFKYDKKMADVVAKYGVACCLMHNKDKPEYNDFIRDMVKETLECVEIALKSGVKKDKIILDPGVGFGKTYEMNLLAIKHLDKLCNTGYPVLLGCSKKSVIGNTLDLPIGERLEGTLVTTVMAVLSGCAFVRVHDVKENIRAVKMAQVIKNI
ncbi:MAG: dihydropteroate synthase [Ruminococcus sp.]